MSARRSCSRIVLLLWLACALAAPALADTTAPQYDPNGNMTSRSTSLGTTGYTYDALDRLKTEFGPGVDQSFGYDGNGNRQSDGVNVYTLAPNGNRIQTVNGITQVYDPAGHLLDDGRGRTFAYNAAGRLKEVKLNNVLVASYKYNYRGLRTHKITPQGTTLYHYDPQGHLIQTSDPGGVPKQSLHWADDQPIAQVDHTGPTDKIVYLHTDHLNTPRTATDQNGTVVWRWEGRAFGETLPNEDADGDGVPTTINLRYGNSYADSETGWWYMWHRYYDPGVGRFISSDPIGLAGGLNTYSYALNNPLRYFDPDGLAVRFICRYVSGLERTGQKHCFVYVTCPKEGWSTILSLFATTTYGAGVPVRARKSLSTPSSPDKLDDPDSPNNTDDIPVQTPNPGCGTCAYEKSVMERFNSFPSGNVPYWLTGPNSNSFAGGLLGGPAPPIRNAPGLEFSGSWPPSWQ